jgi:uncharacterized protein (DUF58 family)
MAKTGLRSRYYDPEKLATVRNLQLLARTVVEGYISGLHRSPFKGFSSEFAEYREYLPGEDLKHFDWKVFARSDKRYIRQYEEETNLTCTILLDASGSMDYGSSEHLTKFDYAAALSAALTYLMIQQRDSVGLVVFDNQVRRRIPPRHGAGHMRNVLETLERTEAGGRTGIAPALHGIAETSKRRGLVVVLSDLVDDQAEVMNALAHFRHNRNEVIVFNVFDRAEADLPFHGLVEFEDMETRERMQVRAEVVREEYQKQFDAFVDGYRRQCAATRCDYEPVTTDTPYELMLHAYLARRMRSR